jgi:hypothetical protein
MCDSRRNFGFDIGFINHFNIGTVIQLTYSVIINFHTHTKSLAHTLRLFQPAVFSLVVAW